MKTVFAALARSVVVPALWLGATACGLIVISSAMDLWTTASHFGWGMFAKGAASEATLVFLGRVEGGAFACLVLSAMAIALGKAAGPDSAPKTA